LAVYLLKMSGQIMLIVPNGMASKLMVSFETPFSISLSVKTPSAAVPIFKSK
jgi:hypothetical protein